MILSTHGIVSSISGIDADWLAYYNRVIAAGGSLSTTEQNATKTLVADLKAYGIWSAMKAIYPMVGASAAACAQNLKSSSFTGTFTSGWTFASTGVTGNGTSAYFDTAMNPSTNLTKTNHHISFYSRTQNSSVSGWNIGCETAPNASNLSVYFAVVAQKGFLSGPYPANWSFSTSTNTLGLHIGSETSSTSSKLYQNSSLLATNTTLNATPFSNLNYYIGANNTGTAASFTPHQCAFASIGDGLTDTQASNFYTAVQAFQTTLSRQV
jgi:hypothetical protein